MFPSTWIHDAWRNIETSTASHTFLSGNTTGPNCDAQVPVSIWPASSGWPCSSSQVIAACWYVKRVSFTPPCGCTKANTTMLAAMRRSVTNGMRRVGLSSRSGSTAPLRLLCYPSSGRCRFIGGITSSSSSMRLVT